MGLLKDLYKSLTKSANKSARGGGRSTQKKKKRQSGSSSANKGSRGSGASGRSGGGSNRPSRSSGSSSSGGGRSGRGNSNNKPKSSSNNRPNTSRPSGGISNHRTGSGALRGVGKAGIMGGNNSAQIGRNSNTNTKNKPVGAVTKAGVIGRSPKESGRAKGPGEKATQALFPKDKSWKDFQEEKRKLYSQGKISATGGRVKTHTGNVGTKATKSFKKDPLGDRSVAVFLGKKKAEKDAKEEFKNRLSPEEARALGFDVPKGKAVVRKPASKAPEADQYYLTDNTSKTEKEYVKKELKKKEAEDIKANIQARKEFDKKHHREYKAKDLTMAEVNQAQNAYRLNGEYGKKMLGDELSRKLGSNIAYNTNKNTAARVTAGVLQGLSYGDIIHGGPATYGKNEQKALEEAQESGAYNIGYGAGVMGNFALSGVNGLGKGIAQIGTKGAVKGATKSASKKFIQNRLGELAAETPLNLIDAAKMSKDGSGEIDKKDFIKWAGINSLITGGMGSAIEGAGMKMTKKQAKQYIELAAKQKTGVLTVDEGARFKKLQAKLSLAAKDIQAAKSNEAYAGLTKGADEVAEARLKRKARAAAIKTGRPYKVGYNTTVHSPYEGPMPVHNGKRGATVPISDEAVTSARKMMPSHPKKSKGKAKNYAKEALGKYRTVRVNNASMDGKEYGVYLGGEVHKKITYGGRLTPNKLAIINNIDDVVSNAEYLDSGKFDPTGKKKKNVVRYDYFESKVSIGGKDYIVSLDVEVNNVNNKYRSHEVSKLSIDEMGTKKAETQSAARAIKPTAKRGSAPGATPGSVPSITQSKQRGKPQKASNTTKPTAKEPEPKPSANETRTAKRYDDAIKGVDDGNVDKNILNDIEVTKDGDTWREMTTGDELTPKQVKDRITEFKNNDLAYIRQIESDPRYAPYKEWDGLVAEWENMPVVNGKLTPEAEARGKEIEARMDELGKEGGFNAANYDAKKEATLREIRGDIAKKDTISEPTQKVDAETREKIDNDLVARNEDVVKNSDDELAGTERPTPDSGELPKELKQNRKMARFTKDSVADYLRMDTDTTFTTRDLKDIDGRVERISNMIANNDRAGAKSEVEKLVDEYYDAPDHLEEPRDPGEIRNDKDDLLALKKQIRETTFKLPKCESTQSTLKQFYEDIGLPRTGKRGFNVRVNTGGGYTPLAGRFESNKVMIGIDEIYPELQREFPELLPKYDTGDYYQQFRALVSVFNTKVADIPTTTRIPVDPQELKDFVAGEILSAAEKNAGAYKGVNEPKPFKDISKMSEDELQAHIRGEEKHLKNAIDKYGADSNRVKEIRQHIEESNNRLDEMRGERKAKEPKPEPKQETPKPKETKAEAPKAPGKTPPGYENLTSEDLPKAFKEEAAKEAREAKAKEKPNDPLGYTVSKPDGVDPKFTNWFREAFTSFRRKTESSLVGFERAASKSGSKDLRHQATEVYLAKNRATSWIEGERAGFDRKVSRDGLNTIFEKNNLFGKKNKQRKADFSNYLLYKHAINRLDFDKPVHMADGGGSAYSKADYEAMIKQIEEKYPKSELEAFEKDIKGYFDDLMQYRVDSGLVTKEFAETMAKRYPNYVPTYRDNDDWLRGLTTIDNSLEARIGQSVKTAKGGSAPIEDLYQQMARLTKTTIRDAEENVLMNTYAKVLGFDGVEKLPEGTKLDDIANSAITISDKGSGGWNVTFWHEGEPVNMAVNKQIALGLKEFNGDSFRKLVAASSILNKFGTAYKRLITDWNLLFGVRNGARDLQQAAVNSKDSKAFAANIPNAWRAIASPKNNPYMRLYKANGGMYSTLVQQGKQIREPGTKNLFSKGVDNSVGHAIKAIEKVNGAIEIAPRLAEFIGTINKHADAALKKKGSSIKQLREATAKDMFPDKKIADLTADELEKLEDGLANKLVDMVGKDVIDEAMHNAADITLNFSRSGVITKALNAGPVPYLNPSVQGLSKTIRLFSEGNAEGWKALFNLSMKIGTMTIAPAAFNELMLADDKAYQSLNTRDKDTNFFIPIGDGKFIKIPKPRETAVLAEPAGYGMRYFIEKASIGEINAPDWLPTNIDGSGNLSKDGVVEKGEYSGWKDLGQMFKSVVDNIGPVNPLSDNIFSPLFRLAQNKTWYGGSIDSTSDVLGLSEGKIKHSEVRDETTSYYAKEIADFKIGGKKVSDIMHLSPKKIDDFMDSYFGVIYDLGIAPTSDANHGNPILTQFVKDSVFSNKNGTELWSEFEKTMAPDTLGGKAKRAAKKFVLGNTKWTIEEKNIEAKDWLNLKGYDDITYSDARNKILYDKDLTQKQKDAYDRKIKIWQNEMRRDLVYGKKEVTPEMDPIRKISSIFGVDKAMKDFTYTYEDPETGEKKNQHLDAWNAFKKSGSYKKDSKAASKKFIDFYSKMRWTNGKIGESKSFPSWMAASVIAATEKGNNDDLAKAYIRPSWDDGGETTEKIIQRGKNYRDYGFTQGYFRTSQRSIFKAGRDLGYEYTSKLQPWDKAMALATDKKKFADGAYYSADTSGKVSRRMNYARYLNKTGHDTEEINKFAKKYKLELPGYVESQTKEQRSQSWKAFNAKVEAAVNEAYKDAPDAVKASVYHVITDDNYNFPFGKIADQKQKNDTGITDLDKYEGGGWGRGGRRGRRGGRRGRRGRGGGGSGSGGGGTVPKTATGAINGKVTDPFGKSGGRGGKSNLDDAYRKKYAKLIAESRKKH